MKTETYVITGYYAIIDTPWVPFDLKAEDETTVGGERANPPPTINETLLWNVEQEYDDQGNPKEEISIQSHQTPPRYIENNSGDSSSLGQNKSLFEISPINAVQDQLEGKIRNSSNNMYMTCNGAAPITFEVEEIEPDKKKRQTWKFTKSEPKVSDIGEEEGSY